MARARLLSPAWLLGTLALAAFAPPGLHAAANLQIFTLEQNDTSTSTDNVLVQTTIHWADEDQPVRMLAFRPTGRINEIIPPTANLNGIPDYAVQQAYSRALQTWNDIEIDGHEVSDFRFEDFVLTTDFIPLAQTLNPAGVAQLDGLNIITFYDPLTVGDLAGISPSFVILRDFNIFDLNPPLFEIPIEFIGLSDGTDAPLAADLDGDGAVDTLFFRTEFHRGEIIDNDIALTTLVPVADLPVDPDDIPDDLFEDTVFGTVDLQVLVTHELGHSFGLAHTFLVDPIMHQVVNLPTINPYDRREASLDDAVACALTYPGDGLDALGAIAGSLISGAQADGVDPTDFTAQPPDPALLYLFQNPVFVGVPDPGFDLNAPDEGFVPRAVASADGPIRLLSWVYAGNDAVFPATALARGPADLNSDFFIPGLPPRDDYRLYIQSQPPPGPFNEVAASGVVEDFESEFFGGAVPLPTGVGTGRDVNDATDNTVENRHIQIAVNEDGQFTVGFDTGPALLFGHPTPATSYTTVRVIAGGTTRDFTNRLQPLGSTIDPVVLNDGGNIVTGVWQVEPGLQVSQTLRIITAGGGTPNADDVQITYELTNVSDQMLSAGVRLLLDTITGDIERNPFIINGQAFTEGTVFAGPAVPATYSMENPTFPRLKIEGVLDGPGATRPSRFVIGFFPDMVRSVWDIDPGDSFTDPLNLASDGAAAIFFDPVEIPPGTTRTVSTVYGGFADEILTPETGIPLGSENQAGEVSAFGDDPTESEPIPVVAGVVTGPLNIFTNTGVEPPGGPPPDSEVPPPPDPVLGPPDEPGGEVFPVDRDASIDLDVADFDNDGDLDIVYANTLAVGVDPNAAINRLYLNGGFANELPLGDFVDVTFGRNGIPDGPPPVGDDRFPIVFDRDPFAPGFQSDIVSESTSGVIFGDFDGDGWVDLYVSNFATVGFTGGGQNRIFMNREGTFNGETFRHFVDETLGIGGPPREPGLLNAGPFTPPLDFSFRCDVGDIDADGDLDIVVSEDTPISTGQIMAIPLPDGSDFFWSPAFNLRVLINDGDGFFTDDTLGADGLFGGRPRGVGEIAGLSIETSPDRDRVPPNLWDYDEPTDSTLDSSDLGRDAEVVLSQFGGDTNLDIFRVATMFPNGGNTDRMVGQEQLLENIGNGYFMNVTYGGPPWQKGNNSDYLTDPDIDDVYPRWTPSAPFLYPPALIGYPDTFQSDVNVSPTAEANQLPWLVEDDSFGGAAGDLDNDGDMDLVVANMSLANTIITMVGGANLNGEDDRFGIGGVAEALDDGDRVRPITSSETVRAETVLPISDVNRRCREVALGDIDFDGDPDAYFAVDGTGAENVTSPPANDILLLNDGSGGLLTDVSDTGVRLQNPLPTYDVEFADVDNDGDLDAVLAAFTEQNLYLENFAVNAPATPTTPGDVPLFNDATAQYLPNSLFGSSVPGASEIYSSNTTCATFADLDADGDLDLYIGNGLQTFSDINILLMNGGKPINEGVRVFKAAHTAFPAPKLVQGRFGSVSEGGCDANFDGTLDTVRGSTPTSDVDAADFDGDGDYDLLVTNNGFRSSMLINFDSDEIGPGSRLDIIESASPPEGVVIVSSFSNNIPDPDFHGDGLMVDVTGLSLPGPQNPIPILGVLRPDTLSAPLLLSRGAAVGDLNGDGRLDIFFANGVEGGTVRNALLINQGVGANQAPEFEAVNDPTNDGYFTPASLNERDSFDAAIFDANNDGHLDIYVADKSVTTDFTHVLWVNDGTAHFQGAQVPITNLNGALDQNTVELVVADFDGDGEPTEDINGNGFLDPDEDLDGDGVIDFVDLNGNSRHDADYDVLLCNARARDLILINDGQGNFTDQSDLLMPSEDRDGDGILDPGEDTDGNGAIGPIIRNTFDGDAADVDLDGDIDVALAQDNPSPLDPENEAITVQLLINDGTGRFTDVTRHEIGTTAFSAVGRTDAPVSSWNANSRSVEFGDVDGDTDPDLFVGNIGLIGTGAIAGNYNVLLINRMIGTNLNARSARGIPPGFGRSPVVTMVSPPSAVAAPQDLWVTVNGLNFELGAEISFGQGIQVIGAEWRLPNQIRALLRVLPGATPGPRTVTVTNPDGRSGHSAAGAFSLGLPSGGGPIHTAVPRTSWAVYR